MSNLFRFRNTAIVTATMTLAPAAEASAMAWATGDQDGMQDPDWIRDSRRDSHRVVDPQIEPGQDGQVKPGKVVDSRYKPGGEPDTEHVIDPDIDPVEGPEENRVINPSEKIDRIASETGTG